MPPDPSQRTLQDKLLAAIDELIEAYESAVAQEGVTISAGPFARIGDLRAFERAIAEIPGVQEVRVRGYEGADRAILDVSLQRPAEDPPPEATQ